MQLDLSLRIQCQALPYHVVKNEPLSLCEPALFEEADWVEVVAKELEESLQVFPSQIDRVIPFRGGEAREDHNFSVTLVLRDSQLSLVNVDVNHLALGHLCLNLCVLLQHRRLHTDNIT